MPSLVVYGKKGGGKTYYALRLIEAELVFGDRVVCTNVALNLPVLSAYLAKKYPRKNIDVTLRVRILTRDETRRFWLHRELGNDIPDVSDEDYARGKNPDYTSHWHGGIFYVIDEIHIDFDARAWASIGRGLTYYNSQERKLLDDQIYITQFLDLVDKRVKGFGQEFVQCTNWRYQRFLTIFSKGAGMEALHWPFPPSQNHRGLPNEKHAYRIDPELAACYDTSAGVGFRGPGVPDNQKSKKRGVPMNVLFLALPVAIFAATKGMDLVTSHIAGSRMGHALTAKTADRMAPGQTQRPPAETPQPAAQPRGPVVRGVVMRGSELWVSVEGRGWLPVLAREADSVMLGDGTKVPAVDVISGRSEVQVAAR